MKIINILLLSTFIFGVFTINVQKRDVLSSPLEDSPFSFIQTDSNYYENEEILSFRQSQANSSFAQQPNASRQAPNASYGQDPKNSSLMQNAFREGPNGSFAQQPNASRQAPNASYGQDPKNSSLMQNAFREGPNGSFAQQPNASRQAPNASYGQDPKNSSLSQAPNASYGEDPVKTSNASFVQQPNASRQAPNASYGEDPKKEGEEHKKEGEEPKKEGEEPKKEGETQNATASEVTNASNATNVSNTSNENGIATPSSPVGFLDCKDCTKKDPQIPPNAPLKLKEEDDYSVFSFIEKEYKSHQLFRVENGIEVPKEEVSFLQIEKPAHLKKKHIRKTQ